MSDNPTTKRFPRVSELSVSYTSAGSGPYRRKTWFSRLWPWALGLFLLLFFGNAVSEIARAVSVARATFNSVSLAQERRSAELAVIAHCVDKHGPGVAIVAGQCKARLS